MMKKVVLGILTFCSTFALAQSNSQARQSYIDTYKNIAIREMNEYGIPASITLAQGILESADGRSELAKEGNNHFGIKCHSDWNGKKMYHDDDENDECFRVYEHAEASFRDHSLFLKEKRRYAVLFTLDPYDYKAWAEGLKDCGYATNRRYPELLIGIIEANELYKYDHMEYTPSGDIVAAEGHPVLRSQGGLEYIIVKKNDDWNRLSIEVDVTLDRLLDYNDLKWNSQLEEGMILYLERKHRRGPVDNYRVQSGDSMYSISQKFGIRIDRLYKRNRMLPGEEPSVGETLVLRGYRD